MSEPSTEDPIRHEVVGRRGTFFIERDGRRVAELTYSRGDESTVVDHTWVDPALRGGKAARRLVDTVVQWARAERVRLVPTCSYVRVVLARTPEYSDVL
ncbi:MAG TPA: GNAT family N-acetyltransferase [Burkholderiaceae bacterium]|nr:GNAT family N-acetyltransferase [Burkholderiaceae bacterium]HRA78149.1 GNAT family N-acetyltransferase [Burkholderiaceae bacterium]